MKKNVLKTAMLVMVLLAPTKDVMAVDPVNIDITTKNEQSQTQTADASAISTSNSAGGTGIGEGGAANSTLTYNERLQLLIGNSHQIGTPGTQIDAGGYGTSAAESVFHFAVAEKNYRIWTMAKHRTMLTAMKKVEGSVSWDKLMNLVIVYPEIENVFSPMGESPVYFLSDIRLLERMKITEENIVGKLIYDTESSKKYFVPQGYLDKRSCFDAGTVYGGNVVVKVGEYVGGVFISESSNRTLGGVLSKIISCSLGGAITPGIGGANTESSKRVKNGAVYAVLRVDNPEQFLNVKVSVPVVDVSVFSRKIKSLEEGRDNCKKKCINNFNLSQQIGDVFLAWHHVAPSDQLLHDAEAAYARAEENFLRGVEPNGKKTSSLKNAKRAMDNVYYNWSYVKLLLEGKDKADAFAGSKGLTEAPDKFGDLK